MTEQVWRVQVDDFGLERFATLQPADGQRDAFWTLDWPREAFNLAVIERAGRLTYSLAEEDSPRVVSRDELVKLGVPRPVLAGMEAALVSAKEARSS